MVKVKDLPKFFKDVQEMFGFLMSQQIKLDAPKKSTRMSKTFTDTYRFENGKIKWTTPYYTKYVNDGTVNIDGSTKIKARRFIQKSFHQHGNRILKQAFRVINKRYK